MSTIHRFLWVRLHGFKPTLRVTGALKKELDELQKRIDKTKEVE